MHNLSGTMYPSHKTSTLLVARNLMPAVLIFAGLIAIVLLPTTASTPAFAVVSGEDVVTHLRENALELGGPQDLGPLLDQAGSHRLVLLGEASHGTSEYYTWRAEISRRLIEDHGFDFILVEGDWPLAFRVNKHVKHLRDEPVSTREVMRHFSRWPQWMWGNEEVKDLIGWMHGFNADRPAHRRAGFYGMDIYAHEQGMDDVVAFLEDRDPQAGRMARNNYRCFTRHRDMQAYLQMVHQTRQHCGEDFEEVRRHIEENREVYMQADSLRFVNAWQASRMVVQAELHIRGNLVRGPDSWNYRVDHFYDAARNLLELYGEDARGIVWAHNTHIGDARATDMRNSGMRNIGQIAREELGAGQVYAVGFGTYRGDVLAARQWEGAMEKMQVPGAVSGSYEYLMQQAGISPMLLLMDDPQEHQPLMQPRGNRAVGVIYQSERDATQNYVRTILPERYNAFIFFEETRALTPLSQ
jgi:erythromycin esterase